MPKTTRIEVKGLKELAEKMRLLSSEVSLKIGARATASAAAIVKKAAKDKAPVRTGSLRDSIIVKKLPKSETRLTEEYIVTVRGRGKKRPYTKKGVRIQNAPHAHFVEFGTVKMGPEPFLGPALTNNKGAAIEAMKAKLAEGIDKATK